MKKITVKRNIASDS